MKKLFNFFIIIILFGLNYKKKILQSHVYLKKNCDFENRINDLKELIENYLSQKKSSGTIIDYERSFAQYIFKRFININYFNEKLIIEKCLGEYFYYPLPDDLLNIIKDKGFKINYFISKILWYFVILSNLSLQFIRILKPFFIYKKKSNTHHQNIVIYLSSLPNEFNFDDDKKDLKTNFYIWFSDFFIKKYELKKNILFIHENKKIKNVRIKTKDNYYYETLYDKNFIYRNFKISKYFPAVFKSFILILNIGIDKIFILGDIIKYEYLNKYNDFKIDYALFNNSNMAFQPLWSKLKNFKGQSRNYLYYYSTNIIPLTKQPDLTKNIFGYRLHTWDNYILWNNYQKKWIERCKQTKINCSILDNFIPFEGKNISLLNSKNKKIIIFDIPPRNEFIYYNLMHLNNIYTIEYCLKFILDIIKSVQEIYPQAKIIYKSKARDIQTMHPEYKKLVVNYILKNKDFDVYYNEVSAHSLIMDADASISIPFTSTALIGHYLKKPSIYYHPDKEPLISEYFPKNIDQVNNENDLRSWLRKI